MAPSPEGPRLQRRPRRHDRRSGRRRRENRLRRRRLGSDFGGSGARGGVLVASSSAIMRRMEARISSIDGSCDFRRLRHAHPRLALLTLRACLLARSLACASVQSIAKPLPPGTSPNHTTSTMQWSRRVCHGESRRPRRDLWTPPVRRNRPNSLRRAYLPSGVRTPIHASRTC